MKLGQATLEDRLQRMDHTKADKLSWMHTELKQLGTPLLRYATRIVGDTERGRDVVQDTCLRLWESEGVRTDGPIKDWLFRVCRNRAVDVRRREQRLKLVGSVEIETRVSPEAAKESLEQRHDLSRVLEAMKGLPANQQRVLRLRFAKGLSYREIAEEAGLTPTHVGYLIHVAIKTIRSRLELDGPEKERPR
jgi:RNA polymerase sigma-70 factor (ECF subfamily)